MPVDDINKQFGQNVQLACVHNLGLRSDIKSSPVKICAYLGEAAYDRLRKNDGRLVNFDWMSH